MAILEDLARLFTISLEQENTEAIQKIGNTIISLVQVNTLDKEENENG